MKRTLSLFPGGRLGRRGFFAAAGLLLALVLAAHGRIASHGFIQLDDNFYIYQNPHVISGLTADSARWAFGASPVAYWHPVTWLWQMAEAQLLGPRPWAMHLLSLLLHFGNTVLVFALLALWTRAPGRSLFAAALFAVHPANVESVAWLSQKKTLLSAFFGLSSLLAWTLWARRDRAWAYLAFLALLALSLMSKPVFIVVPLVLFLMDFWPLERGFSPGRVSPAQLLGEKAAPALLCLLGAGAALWTNARFEMSVAGEIEFLTRLVQAPWVVFRHLAVLAWPADLCVFHPYPAGLPPAETLGAALALAGITGAAVLARKTRPWLLFGWAWFVAFLFPVTGLVQTGAWPSHADRFLYLPGIGPFLALALEAPGRLPRGLARAAGAALVAVLAALCLFQAGLWKDGVLLFGRSVEICPSTLAANCLGNTLLVQGRDDEALSAYEKALKVNPRYKPSLKNGADILALQGRTLEALEWHARSLGQDPETAMASADEWLAAIRHSGRAMGMHNLGDLFLAAGMEDQALEYFRLAVDLHPYNPHAANNLGLILARRGALDRAEPLFRLAAGMLPAEFFPAFNLGHLYLTQRRYLDAVPWLERAVANDPGNAAAISALGRALAGGGRALEAERCLAEAARLSPGDTESLLALGKVLQESGKDAESIAPLSRAVELLPQDPETRTLLARALERTDRLAEARAQYEWILARFPEDSRAHVRMGFLLGKLGEPDLAQAHFQEAVKLDPGNAEARAALTELEIKDSPDTPAGLVSRGLESMDQKDWQKAESLFREALDRDPGLKAAAYNLACLAAVRGQEDAAAGWLKQAVDLGFSDWEFLAADKDLANIRDTTYWMELKKAHPALDRQLPVPSEPPASENEEER